MNRARSPVAVAIIVSFALTSLVAGRVAAQDPPSAAAKEQARALHERATTEYRLGYFEEAARMYEQAYRLLPDPALLYNVGQAYRMAGQRDKALVAYKSYMRTSALDAPNREVARKHVEELEAAVGGPPSRVSVPFRLQPTDMPVGPTSLIGTTPATAHDEPRPWRWWLWGAVGALVVGGVTTAVVLAGRPRDPTSGTAGIAVVP